MWSFGVRKSIGQVKRWVNISANCHYPLLSFEDVHSLNFEMWGAEVLYAQQKKNHGELSGSPTLRAHTQSTNSKKKKKIQKQNCPGQIMSR